MAGAAETSTHTGAETAPGAASEPGWPQAAVGQRVVCLLDWTNGLERRLLEDWVARHRPEGADVEILSVASSRRRRRRPLGPLEATLAAGGDPLLQPLRVIWLAPEREGRRKVTLRDLLKLGDPRDPDWLRARWLRFRRPESVRIIAGEPAPESDLRRRWQAQCTGESGSTEGLAGFVRRQAVLALERAERRVRGARYKVPRLVREDILARPSFRGRIASLARELGQPEAKVMRRAISNLKEIAASHSPFVIDLVIQLWNAMIRRGYDVEYDDTQIDRLRGLAAQHPIVFLPSHKSNLDHPALQWVLHENGFPPNHTAGGINMNFFPVGPLVRRAGTFFIRRSFKDDVVYKAVLQHYLDYLIEKRFPLEWYIEGGRSRSGKLLPPRFGLLAYVFDAYLRGKSEDVQLIPVSIAYDQISDVGDYAHEQLGGAKQKESLGWFIGVLRRLSNRYGRIQVRFGEPLSLAKTLGPPDPTAPPNPDETSLALQKLAFEVCVRINDATPVTQISLVCLALLGRGDRALTVDEMVTALANLVYYSHARTLPGHEAIDLESAESVQSVLDLLVESGLLTRYDEGPEAVYAIANERHLAAAYYRNSIIHYFVNASIAELALLRAAEVDVPDRKKEFWDEAMRLRDLLKFEFFFPEKEHFRHDVDEELKLHDPHWEQHLEGDAELLLNLFPKIRPLSSHRILRPFLESYRVVGDVLEQLEPDGSTETADLLPRCMALGRQYQLQRHIKRAESISQVLFGTALKLARNRDLLGPDGPELPARRAALAGEIRDAIRRTNAIEAMVRGRHAGLVKLGND
ncbi:MAG: glycerol-3-phosphate 1-O-acyltransferase [Myxococcota bacterium]|nr:glycerol-3-phosphate 1-O-acyltransferase [Myxococcota bacterium]